MYICEENNKANILIMHMQQQSIDEIKNRNVGLIDKVVKCLARLYKNELNVQLIDIRTTTVQNRKETQWINRLNQSYIILYRLSSISDIYVTLLLHID
jgi:hypothetical protein